MTDGAVSAAAADCVGWSNFSGLSGIEGQASARGHCAAGPGRLVGCESRFHYVSDLNALLESAAADDGRVTDRSWDELPLHRTREDKIIELAKKVRRLNVALEREKSAKSKLLEHVKTSRRLEDERAQSKNLKSDLQNAQKAIASELGADVPIAQDKIKELTAALSSANLNPAEDLTAERKTREKFAEVQSSKKKELDRLSVEFQASQEHLRELKVKYNSATSRNKYLESEIRDMKSKIGMLVEKSEKDDVLILRLQSALKRKTSLDTTDRPQTKYSNVPPVVLKTLRNTPV
ncbi:hypothetical protein HDU67_000770 [Dinochytrium kinnereticum]|nr:hypothetical protein HDU67_000770 [Dinochytrium kinnereticum]